MTNKKEFQENSAAVQAHLEIAQSIIQRMSTNSAACKAWCIALVSAILVVVADKNKPQYMLIAAVPVLLFFALDVYYLALEIRFREAYNKFIHKLHHDQLVAVDLYAISPADISLSTIFKSLSSFSIWPFYFTLLGMAWFIKSKIV